MSSELFYNDTIVDQGSSN